MSTKVWIIEEYGYRNWLWVHPGTIDDVIAAWKSGERPVGFWGRHDAGFAGTCEQIWPHDDVLAAYEADLMSEDEARVKLAVAALALGQDPNAYAQILGVAAYGHVHEEDDTYLIVDGVRVA